jgi:hypothetical protein
MNNLFIIAGITLSLSLGYCFLVSCEEYDYPEPNLYVHGQQVAGTVYASDPENSPGLGWIL